MQIGDRVVVTIPESYWNGRTGTIVEILNTDLLPYTVKMDTDDEVLFDEHELIKESLCDDN